MAYKDPTFNANLFTDLLSTYLTNQSSEREKYFKAEQSLSKPQYKASGSNIVQIDPRTGQSTVDYEGPKDEKEPKFEDVPMLDANGNPTGETIKRQWVGGNFKDSQFNLPMGFKAVGGEAQYKPEDANKLEKDLIKETRDFSTKRIAQLRRIKEGRINAQDTALIQVGFLPPKWDEDTFGPELKYYQNVLKNTKQYLPAGLTGIPVYDPKLQNNSESSEKKNFWEENVAK